ncbi:MAG: ABC-type transport auxiliary lipoprotein family protein [Myxococcales bacterium]|jgi:ABC-type uncharacterized transport system auxiliary subunit
MSAASRAAIGWLLVLGLAACSQPALRHYYTLTYPAPKASYEKPFPYTIRVKDLRISPTYSGDQVVFRQDVHEVQYYKDRRWTERPQQMVSDLIRKHLRQSGLAQQVTERLREKPPDFVLEGEIEAIEELACDEDSSFAHLAMELRLVRFADDAVVWRYVFDERRRVMGGKGRSVVRAMSGLLEEQMNLVVEQLARHFEALARGETPPVEQPGPARPAVRADAGGTAVEAKLVVPDPKSALNQHPQLLADDTEMPAGKGAIFLPALSDSDAEPAVAVYRDDELVAEGQTGRRLVVEPGAYRVRFGSGARGQQLSVNVSVEEGRVTAVEPSWAALELRVVDERFIPFRGTYELISVADREEFGIGFGADEEQGEQLRIWVLEPGLYKIVQSGGTYRDRTNFATVYLEPGKLTRFVLVQDKESGEFRGAGVIADEDDVGRVAGNWKSQAIVGGDFKLSNTDEGGVDGWNIDLGFYLDAMVRYLDEPHFFLTRLELEEGVLRTASSDRFEPTVDRLYLHSIYIYQLSRWFGPYARAGLETKILPRFKSFDAPTTVDVVDEAGNTVETLGNTDLVKLGSPFSPLQVKEGLGGNMRVLRTLAFDLDVRAGIGARQYWANGERVWESDGNRVKLVSDYQIEGFEGAVVGIARISRWVILGTELDGLVPFRQPENTVLTWRNQISLRLVSFASLNYQLNVTRDPNRRAGQMTVWEQLFQLRFSYGLL